MRPGRRRPRSLTRSRSSPAWEWSPPRIWSGSYRSVITREVADKALSMLEVDACGLDRTDRRILATIIEKFNGGPVGLDTIAAAVSEETDTIEDVYEPFLLQMGFINRTPRGRTVTAAAYRHLGIPCPAEAATDRQEPLWRE